MGPKRWSKISSISPGWGCILKSFCRVGIYSQSQVKKSEALKIILNMCRTVYSSSQKTRHELTRGGLCFTRQASICMQNVSVKRIFKVQSVFFPKLGRTKQGVDIENICHHRFQGQYVKQKGFNVDYLWQKRHPKASMWGASCETGKGFALRTAVTKRIHFGGILL